MPGDGGDKPLSGYQKALNARAPYPKLKKVAREAIAKLGPPPLENPDTMLGWWRRLLATVTWLVAIDAIDPQRARLLKDMVFAGGATHNRGVLEEKMSDLETKLADRRTAGGAMRVEPGDPTKRGPNSRGVRRGPRPVPDDSPELGDQNPPASPATEAEPE